MHKTQHWLEGNICKDKYEDCVKCFWLLACISICWTRHPLILVRPANDGASGDLGSNVICQRFIGVGRNQEVKVLCEKKSLPVAAASLSLSAQETQANNLVRWLDCLTLNLRKQRCCNVALLFQDLGPSLPRRVPSMSGSFKFNNQHRQLYNLALFVVITTILPSWTFFLKSSYDMHVSQMLSNELFY